MDPSQSSGSHRPPLLYHFPWKLWTIVNECGTGAVAWSSDGTTLIFDYPKFQSEYLENRVDIFKTKNIASFVRQLNLYGFRKVSPYQTEVPLWTCRVTNSGDPNIHAFRHPSFVRGRPDLLSGVTRKTGAQKAKTAQRKSNPVASMSPPSSKRAHLETARMMHLAFHSQRMPQVLQKNREALSRMLRDSSSKAASGAASSLAVAGPSHGFSGENWNDANWYLHHTNSDTTSSDQEHEWTCPRTEDANATSKDFIEKVEPSTEHLMAYCPTSIHSSIVTGLSSSSVPSPWIRVCGNLGALLDSSEAPHVIPTSTSRNGNRDEGRSIAQLEDSSMIRSLINNLGESVRNDLYDILISEDEDDNHKESADTYTDGAQSAATSFFADPDETKEC